MSADRNIQIPEYWGETPLEKLNRIRMSIAIHPEKFTPEEAMDLGVGLIRAKLEYFSVSGGVGSVVRDLTYVIADVCFKGNYSGVKQYLNMEGQLTFTGHHLRGDGDFMAGKDPMSAYSFKIKAIARAIPDRVAA